MNERKEKTNETSDVNKIFGWAIFNIQKKLIEKKNNMVHLFEKENPMKWRNINDELDFFQR